MRRGGGKVQRDRETGKGDAQCFREPGDGRGQVSLSLSRPQFLPLYNGTNSTFLISGLVVLLVKDHFSPPTPSTSSCRPEEDEAACPTPWEVDPSRAGQGSQEHLIKGRKAEVTGCPKSWRTQFPPLPLHLPSLPESACPHLLLFRKHEAPRGNT